MRMETGPGPSTQGSGTPLCPGRVPIVKPQGRGQMGTSQGSPDSRLTRPCPPGTALPHPQPIARDWQRVLRLGPEVHQEGREPLPEKAGESTLLSRSGGEKGLRGSVARTLGVALEGTRRVGDIWGSQEGSCTAGGFFTIRATACVAHKYLPTPLSGIINSFIV